MTKKRTVHHRLADYLAGGGDVQVVIDYLREWGNNGGRLPDWFPKMQMQKEEPARQDSKSEIDFHIHKHDLKEIYDIGFQYPGRCSGCTLDLVPGSDGYRIPAGVAYRNNKAHTKISTPLNLCETCGNKFLEDKPPLVLDIVQCESKVGK